MERTVSMKTNTQVSFTFQRVEKKYHLQKRQYRALLEKIGDELLPDEFGKSTILSLYLDTDSGLLVRNSIEARDDDKAYKEKLRLRSYGTPGPESTVYLELKKKYLGVVYKRRVDMTLSEAEAYFRTGIPPKEDQIMREIDYAMKYYGQPRPGMMIAYDREAFYVKGYPALRITFDQNVRYRDRNLFLTEGGDGTLLTQDGEVLMEVKTDGAMPLWLSRALNECRIFPASFSKYGSAYEICCRQKARDNSIIQDIIPNREFTEKRKGGIKYA